MEGNGINARNVTVVRHTPPGFEILVDLCGPCAVQSLAQLAEKSGRHDPPLFDNLVEWLPGKETVVECVVLVDGQQQLGQFLSADFRRVDERACRRY